MGFVCYRSMCPQQHWEIITTQNRDSDAEESDRLCTIPVCLIHYCSYGILSMQSMPVRLKFWYNKISLVKFSRKRFENGVRNRQALILGRMSTTSLRLGLKIQKKLKAQSVWNSPNWTETIQQQYSVWVKPIAPWSVVSCWEEWAMFLSCLNFGHVREVFSQNTWITKKTQLSKHLAHISNIKPWAQTDWGNGCVPPITMCLPYSAIKSWLFSLLAKWAQFGALVRLRYKPRQTKHLMPPGQSLCHYLWLVIAPFLVVSYPWTEWAQFRALKT